MRLVAGLVPALTKDSVSKLSSVGVNNVLTFLERDVEVMAEESDISYRDLKSIRELIVAKYAAIPSTGAHLLDVAKVSTTIISTGNESFDSLLGGGLMTGEIIEICGKEGSGKSMLCLYIALHCAVKLKHPVLYIDFASSVSNARISAILERMEVCDEDIEGALSRLKVVQPQDYVSLLQTLENLYQSSSHKRRTKIFGSGDTKGKQIKLLVLDSVYAYFHHLNSMRMIEMGYLNQLASCLKKLSVDRHMAVIVVNLTERIASGNGKLERHFCTRMAPILNRYWSHVPSTRLHIELLRERQSTQSSHAKEENSSNEASSGNSSSLNSFHMNVTVWKSSRLKTDSTEISLFDSGL